MQIHSISKVLGLPLVISALVIVYYSYNQRTDTSVYIFIPVVLLVALYVFHGILDHWWQSKFPIKLDERILKWLERHFPPYNLMNADDKQKFQSRLSLYMEGRQFNAVGSEIGKVPEDIKCMVAAHGVHLSLGLDDYLIGDYDRIYLYKHPFPSPIMQFLHNVETNEEDGVIILSLEQLTNAIIYPTDYFNTAYYAYAEAITTVRGIIGLPISLEKWDSIKEITGFDHATILQQTGLKEVSATAVHISAFLRHTKQYSNVLPDEYKTIASYLKYNVNTDVLH